MIVSVRSNIETKRIELKQEDPTLGALLDAISSTYGIPSTEIGLSFDLKNEEILDGDPSNLLRDMDVKHGSMLYLCGRMQK